jgi:endonuclease/exonuclease/phosphatase (EEP) superfamily protein YafD
LLLMDSTQSASVPAADLVPELRQQVFRWLWRWCGRLAVALMLLWTAAFVLQALSLRWLGEANLCTAFLLFLPPGIWLLPGAMIWLFTLLFRWRAALVLGTVSLLFFALQFGWRIGSEPEPVARDQRSSDTLVILTNNRGQGGGHSLRPFKNHIQPDIMVFQESATPASTYLADPGYGEFIHGETLKDFTLISRFPVRPGRLIQWSGGRTPVSSFIYAARFEVDWNGRLIAVYVVHLRSPREVLLGLRWGGFLHGIPLPFKGWRDRAAQEMVFWQNQMDMAADLERQVSAESLPCIVAGDFNAPHVGAIHRRLTGQLQDAHEVNGHGFGFTFPGETHNPLSLGGPWLRIDQILLSAHWTVEACWTEDLRKSQHRAVAALLKLKDTK